ncbi:MAG: RNA-guided endonuclease TnpB family protein [Cyanobacteria bacterium P01_A01_bin.17]
MKARYQYRIYPNVLQQQALARLFGCCQVVWNNALSWVMQTPEEVQWPSNAQLQQLCITLAKEYPHREWLSEVSNIPLQQSIADLGVAFTNFFEGRARFPRFKKRSNRQSARFRKGGFSLQGNKVYLAKIGTVKAKWSLPLPSEPSSVTVIKDRQGHYYLSFVVEVAVQSKPAVAPSVGVDLGIHTFAVLSTGKHILPPGYERLNRKLRRARRVLSRRQRGSKRRERARLRVAKLSAKIRNIRRDFLHKLSTRLVQDYEGVCLEDLNVSGMVRNRVLARAISEQGWGELRRLCESKAAGYVDRAVVVIDRWEPTSQYCTDCGYHWGKLDLSIRELRCLGCGRVQDRDDNASRNIESVGAGASPRPKTGQGASVRPRCGAVSDELSTHLADRLNQSAG